MHQLRGAVECHASASAGTTRTYGDFYLGGGALGFDEFGGSAIAELFGRANQCGTATLCHLLVQTQSLARLHAAEPGIVCTNEILQVGVCFDVYHFLTLGVECDSNQLFAGECVSAVCQLLMMIKQWEKHSPDDFEFDAKGHNVFFSAEPKTLLWMAEHQFCLNIHQGETVMCTDVSDGCHIIDRPDHRYLSVTHLDRALRESVITRALECCHG